MDFTYPIVRKGKKKKSKILGEKRGNEECENITLCQHDLRISLWLQQRLKTQDSPTQLKGIIT